MGDPNFKHFWDIEAFSKMGLCIARKIKTELPDWTVIYYDESKAQALRDPLVNIPRGSFEYEVTLPF
jgi:hypothetical protein